ncbi:hypothetical protein U7128_000234 [Bacillus phage KKP_4050]|jgi:hypothetical protein
MTPHYYEWAIKYIDNATKSLNAGDTLDFLYDII